MADSSRGAAASNHSGGAGSRTPEAVPVTVRFITIMQRYSGEGNREVQMELPPEPGEALAQIIERYDIPWKDNLEAQVRVFINGIGYEPFLASGGRLEGGDVIAFIPISGGG